MELYNTLALNTLNVLLPFLNSINRNWCLIGTTGLILHGIENKSDNIDIVTDVEGAKKLEKLLEKYKTLESTPIESDHLNSAVLEYEIGGTHISILSDMKVKVSEGWVRTLELIRKKEIFDFNGYKVFIPSLPDQLRISRLFGREKDMAEAEKIMSYLKA